MTGQSHFMLIFLLRKVTLRSHINSVPWMYAVTPTPYNECTEFSEDFLNQLRTFMVRSWCDRVKWLCGVDVTAYIQGTELIRFRKVTLSGFCVHCKPTVAFIWRIFMFLLYTAHSLVLGFFSSRPNWDPPSTAGECVPPSFGSGGGGAHSPASEGVTLRSWCDHVKWPYGVKKSAWSDFDQSKWL